MACPSEVPVLKLTSMRIMDEQANRDKDVCCRLPMKHISDSTRTAGATVAADGRVLQARRT